MSARKLITASGAPSSELQRRNVASIAKVEAAVLGERSTGERVGRFLVRHAGRPITVILHAALICGWIAWNSGSLPRAKPFDPYPFNLLALCASLEAIILGLLILISQNRLQQEADRRAHLSLQINMLAEVEGTKMLHMLDSLCRHFGIETGVEELLDELKAETDPEQLVETIKGAMPTE